MVNATIITTTFEDIFFLRFYQASVKTRGQKNTRFTIPSRAQKVNAPCAKHPSNCLPPPIFPQKGGSNKDENPISATGVFAPAGTPTPT
jgi:hypothetical protein